MLGGEDHSISVDMESCTKNNDKDTYWSNFKMNRVPKMLCDQKEKYYTPQLVSIGPFHYGNESLDEMQSHKYYYVEKFLKRLSNEDCDKLLEFVYIEKENIDDLKYNYGSESLEGMQFKMKDRYAKNFCNLHELMRTQKYASVVGKGKFEDMIFTDACFIFELFILRHEECCKKSTQGSHYVSSSEEYILRIPLLYGTIEMDLIKFENQIPFYFLEKLYEIAKPYHYLTLVQLCIVFFSLNKIPKPDSIKTLPIKHLTDLQRWSWLPQEVLLPKEDQITIIDIKDVKNILNPKKDQVQKETTTTSYLCSATKLDQAGIDLSPQPITYDFEDFKKIEDSKKVEVVRKGYWFFSSCHVKLPVFQIQDSTEYIMRNIIAMEQCQPDPHMMTPFCNYVFLMDKLIDTEGDVDLLVEKKIIQNHLGSNKEVADVINNLGRNMHLVKFIYSDQYKTIHEIYNHRYNRIRALLMRNYFDNLWKGSSTVVGIIVIIFSIVSSICSVWSLIDKKP